MSTIQLLPKLGQQNSSIFMYFPEVTQNTLLDIEIYNLIDIEAGVVKLQDAEGMETAGWISKGRSEVKNCAALSELFIAKWNNCEGFGQQL